MSQPAFSGVISDAECGCRSRKLLNFLRTKLDYTLKGELKTGFSCNVYVALVWQNVLHLLMFQRAFCELQWK